MAKKILRGAKAKAAEKARDKVRKEMKSHGGHFGKTAAKAKVAEIQTRSPRGQINIANEVSRKRDKKKK